MLLVRASPDEIASIRNEPGLALHAVAKYGEQPGGDHRTEVLGEEQLVQAGLVLDRGNLVRRGAHQQHVACKQGAPAVLFAQTLAMAQPVHHLQALAEHQFERATGLADPR